eukprot:jgi/Tetstr1/448454/TSEL_035722.t1
MERPVSVVVGFPAVLPVELWTEVFGFLPEALDRAAAAAACRLFRAALGDPDRPQDRHQELRQDPPPEPQQSPGADDGDALSITLDSLPTPAPARTLAVTAAVSGSRARLRWCVEEMALVRQALRVSGGLRALFRALGARGDPEFLSFAVDSMLVGDSRVPVDMHAVCDGAARGGYTGVLRWVALREFGATETGTDGGDGGDDASPPSILREHLNPASPRGFMAAQAAAASGNLVVLQWLRDPPLQERMSARARAVLKWSWCSVEARIFEEAAGNGHVHILDWINRRRPTFDHVDARELRHYRELGRWAENSACPYPMDWALMMALCGGHMDAVRWFAIRDVEVDMPRAYEMAARHGRVEVLDWLATLSPPELHMEKVFYVHAAVEGHVESLKWMDRMHAPWSADDFMHWGEDVLFKRHRDSPELMRWLGERGVKWDLEAVCTRAVSPATARWILDLVTSPEVQSNLANVVQPGQVETVVRKIRRGKIVFSMDVAIMSLRSDEGFAAYKELRALLPMVLPAAVINPRRALRVYSGSRVCVEILEMIASTANLPVTDPEWSIAISNCIFHREIEGALCLLRHVGADSISSSAATAAAASCNFEVLRWVCARSQEAGNDEVRRYIRDRCPYFAAEIGDLAMVRWTRKECGTRVHRRSYRRHVCCLAYQGDLIRREHVHIPQDLLETGGRWDVCDKCKRWCQDVEDSFVDT